MFKIFNKKKKGERSKLGKVIASNVSTIEINRVEPERIEPERIEPERIEPIRLRYDMQYRDNNTGEIFIVDVTDQETFNKIMSRKDVTLMFG